VYDYAATVEQVVDADTLVLEIDLGFHVHLRQHVRLAGLDAPELRAPAGQEARDWVQGWLDEFTSFTRAVGVRTELDRTEKFGRVLGVVYLPDQPTATLNQALLDSGRARPYTGGKR